jgi:chromosome segregation ATPase
MSQRFNIRHAAALALFCALVLAAALHPAFAQQDRSAEKAARRQQQQVQQLQQQVTQAQAEKAKVEQDKAAIAKELQDKAQAASRAGAAQKASVAKLAALEAEKTQLAAKVSELERVLDDVKRTAEQALADKDRDLLRAATAFKAKEGERADWQGRFGQQVRMATECTDKNERLLRLNAELLSRWQGKGVFDALRQREPVLGFNDVQIFNLVQDYRDRADAERFVPRVQRP